MNVLVIGETGQTGRHAVTQLLDRGHDVTAFSVRKWSRCHLTTVAKMLHRGLSSAICSPQVAQGPVRLQPEVRSEISRGKRGKRGKQ
jgi:UDP-glucose 4-epimerase